MGQPSFPPNHQPNAMNTMTKQPFPWKRLALHFGWYVIDVSLALLMFTIGFGLQVQSWAALLCIGVGGRYLSYLVSQVIWFNEAKRRAAEAETSAKPGP